MKKKMCRWFNRIYAPACCYGSHQCPRNTNDRCEIIPPKKKDVVVKARVTIDNNGEMWASPWCLPEDGVPCTIHIKAADYAKIRGSK